MVIYIKEGNIFNIKGVANFAHGCNCAGAMGKGIALQFKEKYPKMFVCINKNVKRENLYQEMCLNTTMATDVYTIWGHKKRGEQRRKLNI